MRLNMRSSNKVTIDGRAFTGNNVQINSQGTVIVDGVEQKGNLVGVINVTVEGDVEKLENTSGNVKANQVGAIRTVSGDVECGDASGDVTTVSGDVVCSSISGSVKTVSGDVNKKF